jgi:hypothetical protein
MKRFVCAHFGQYFYATELQRAARNHCFIERENGFQNRRSHV